MRKIILLLLLFSFSCRSSKTTVEKEFITKTDTLIVNKDRFITKKVVDTLFVENPCDSLGNLKPFKNVFKTDKANITIESVNGNIEARINLDSIVSSIESRYKIKDVEVIKDKEVEIIKYRTPFNTVLVLVGSILLNLFFIKRRVF